MKSKTTIDTFANLTDTNWDKNNITETDVHPTLFNTSIIKDKVSSFHMSFEKLMKPNVDFDLWFVEFATLGNLCFLLDFMFRMYFTLRTCVKYWSASALVVPTIDLRLKKDELTKKNPLKMSPGRVIALLITNPLTATVFSVVVFTWTAIVIASIYSPFYKDYVNGCVPEFGNGTFFTQNLYSIGYNNAYHDGSSALIEDLKSFDSKRNSLCISTFDQTNKKQIENNFTLSSLQKSFEDIYQEMKILRKCIDTDLLDKQFLEYCNSTNQESDLCHKGNNMKPIMGPGKNGKGS